MTLPPGDVSGAGDAAATKGALNPGVRLRQYEIRSVIGQGGFGITYAARDLTLHRDVAIKEYLPTALALRENGDTVVPRSTAAAADFLNGRERFLDEARTLARLDHFPAIVRVLEFLEANGTAYMVMALARGETLTAWLERAGRLEPYELDRLLPALLDGLEQVHRAGYLHRDIKPSNILIDRRGLPTLIDFGAARAAVAAGASVAMTAIFTPGYAAPEQFSTARQGPWTDIYGLAATLYQAIAGQPPPQAVDRIIDDKCAPLHKLARGPWRRGLLAAIDAGLAPRASDRPQSIAEWRELMKREAGTTASAGDATVQAGQPAAPPARPASTASKRPMLIAAGVAVLLLAVGGGAYRAFVVSSSTQVAVQDATSAASERVLAEHRQAEEAAQEKRRTEEEAARQEAAARAAAEAEKAQQERRRVEAESQAKSAAEARAKAEAEAQAKAQADAQAKAEAEAKAAADAAARAKAEAEARTAATESDRKVAEAAELALRLTTVDRQRIQVALTTQGFDTRGVDGAFGPHSRDMIAAWQKARGQPATGFLAAAQQQALLKEAATAVGRYDEEEKKRADEARRKAEEEAKAKAASPSPAAAAPASAVGRDGLWYGSLTCTNSGRAPLQGTLTGGSGTFTTGNKSLRMQISGDNVSISIQQVGGPVNQVGVSGQIDGHVTGRSVYSKGTVGSETCTVSLVGP
jgi:peptidoglycan hydrolase-like protein with peptidoglycan-binding domain